jgi:hypothetical protein
MKNILIWGGAIVALAAIIYVAYEVNKAAKSASAAKAGAIQGEQVEPASGFNDFV